MKKIIMLLLLAVVKVSLLTAQNIYKATVKDSLTREPLAGASVYLKGTTIGSSTDFNGEVILKDIPEGIQTVIISNVCYKDVSRTFSFPIDIESETIYMAVSCEDMDEVIIQSTRISRTIQNVPTRVEIIEREEIDEKTNMRPANISMLLHESTGIQVQQTSAVTGSAGIRMQGLDGKYTQLLKDGFPSYGNFASGLSVLEIPPLDLKQVEIIKGPASTLYGGGAIAGVINLISKTPEYTSEKNIIINQSHIGQTNAGAFLSGRNNKTGYTFLALLNYQKQYDADRDDFTELPKSIGLTLNPKLFFFINKNTTMEIGSTFTENNNEGGDVNAIKGHQNNYHTYIERNESWRSTSTFELNKKLRNNARVVVRQSFSVFNRIIYIPFYRFSGRNNNSFTDISYVTKVKNHTVVTGGSWILDFFLENKDYSSVKRDNQQYSPGIYLQDTWDASERIKVEGGVRLEMPSFRNSLFQRKDFFPLTRISILFIPGKNLTSRVSGGTGYKLPTLFTEESESIQYRNLAQLDHVIPERSAGGTADVNYKVQLNEQYFFSVNQMFFYTNISAPLTLVNNGNSFYFMNQSVPIQTTGFETNAKIIFKDNFKFFLGYTYTDAITAGNNGTKIIPFVALHKLNLALIYENPEIFKAGLEAYYTGSQHLPDDSRTPSYWELGAMAEHSLGKFSIYVNAENLGDVRQSKFKKVVSGTHQSPVFDPVWTHTEGFVLSFGIKIKLSNK